MNERDLAERFNQDVDRLLNEAGRTDAEPLLAKYRQALDVARRLAATDFSPESRSRLALRRRLLSQMDAREHLKERQVASMRTYPQFKLRRLLFVAISLALVVLVVTLAWPGALIAAAQSLQTFLQTLVLGEHTTVHQVSPEMAPAAQTPPATPIVEWRGDIWVIRTAIGNFGGNVLPGHDVAVRRFSDLAEATVVVTFSLRQPDYLPAGYVFREAIVPPLDWAILFYEGPGGDIVLAQMPVGEQSSGEAGQFTSVKVGTLTDKPIESVTLNGQTAGWVEGYGLIWEAEGVSYILGSVNLSRDETIRIAESLK
jgi:hypothetical protein